MVVTGKMAPALTILLMTSIAIGLSFNPKVRNLHGSYDTGQYLMLVFLD